MQALTKAELREQLVTQRNLLKQAQYNIDVLEMKIKKLTKGAI